MKFAQTVADHFLVVAEGRIAENGPIERVAEQRAVTGTVEARKKLPDLRIFAHAKLRTK